METKAETVEALQSAISIWNRIERLVRNLNPDDSEEEIYQKTKDAMNVALEQAREGRGSQQ